VSIPWIGTQSRESRTHLWVLKIPMCKSYLLPNSVVHSISSQLSKVSSLSNGIDIFYQGFSMKKSLLFQFSQSLVGVTGEQARTFSCLVGSVADHIYC
jgi:hypothetical protein